MKHVQSAQQLVSHMLQWAHEHHKGATIEEQLRKELGLPPQVWPAGNQAASEMPVDGWLAKHGHTVNRENKCVQQTGLNYGVHAIGNTALYVSGSSLTDGLSSSSFDETARTTIRNLLKHGDDDFVLRGRLSKNLIRPHMGSAATPSLNPGPVNLSQSVRVLFTSKSLKSRGA